QVNFLNQQGIRAACINSSLSFEVIDDILADLNAYQIIYIAPERLVQERFLFSLKQAKISFFVIDEAHCISQWGHDFRPEYRALHLLKQQFPDKAIAAFTATATQTVNHDICQQLRLHHPHKVQSSFDRSNLLIRLIERGNLNKQLLAFLDNHRDDSGIIYAATRKKVDTIYDFLLKSGKKVVKYHAGLSDQDRIKAQRALMNDDAQIIVATVAFGMGIHKSNIRFVLHANMPKSIEQYYQEIGRAGRDGLASECTMWYHYQDLILQKHLAGLHTDETVQQHMEQMAEQMFSFCASLRCRRVDLLQYFSEHYLPTNCEACDNCLSETKVIDGTIIAQKILSCVYRLNQRFGMNYVIEVLRGSKNKNILSRGHERLSTYQIMADCGQKELQHYILSLVQQGYLQFSTGEFPLLQFTATSRKILKDKQAIFFREKKHSEKKSKVQAIDYDKALFAKLSHMRRELAQQAGLPPFVIFHDRTLIEICVHAPKTKESLLQINGIGDEKLKRYGDAVLAIMLDYTRAVEEVK
ncbi:MAG TPA: RecQ family ATP-dependent DNA helicase, partial [Gammaproteobacteria bacterium]|nr:RecQ family ATP-dependent DNA helicase [Gammaproteobacteria bacterium]